jgi:hypothetical protein
MDGKMVIYTPQYKRNKSHIEYKRIKIDTIESCQFETKKMRRETKGSIGTCTYMTFIFVNGGLLFLSTIYKTITKDENTLDNETTVIVINTCVAIQTIMWTLYVHSKHDFDRDASWIGLTVLAFTTISWIGASLVQTETLRVLFVSGFMAFFTIFMLTLFNLICNEVNLHILRISTAFLIFCIVANTVFFNEQQFDLLECVALASYSLVSTVFFLFNYPSQWKRNTESYTQPYESEI